MKKQNIVFISAAEDADKDKVLDLKGDLMSSFTPFIDRETFSELKEYNGSEFVADFARKLIPICKEIWIVGPGDYTTDLDEQAAKKAGIPVRHISG